MHTFIHAHSHAHFPISLTCTHTHAHACAHTHTGSDLTHARPVTPLRYKQMLNWWLQESAINGGMGSTRPKHSVLINSCVRTKQLWANQVQISSYVWSGAIISNSCANYQRSFFTNGSFGPTIWESTMGKRARLVCTCTMRVLHQEDHRK